MNPSEISHLLDLWRASTPGEWEASAGAVEVEHPSGDEPDNVVCVTNDANWKRPTTTQEHANAAFIVAAHTQVPALCRALDEAEAEVERLREALIIARAEVEKREAMRQVCYDKWQKAEDKLAELREQLRRSATVCPKDGCMLWLGHTEKHATAEQVSAALARLDDGKKGETCMTNDCGKPCVEGWRWCRACLDSDKVPK